MKKTNPPHTFYKSVKKPSYVHPPSKRKPRTYIPGTQTKYSRERHWRKFLGITSADVMKMMVKQENRCAICHRQLDATYTNKPSTPHVDHNHETNKVRGVLCVKCNTGLGLFLDNILVLENAIKYLESDRTL